MSHNDGGWNFPGNSILPCPGSQRRKPYWNEQRQSIQPIMEKNMNENRETLEAKYGKVWTAEELEQEFIVTAFIGSTVVVRRRVDDVVGTLEFTNRPHFFFNFTPDKGAE